MKAISASDILRKSAPREFLGASFAHKNRFEPFREPSPAASHRSRLGSNTSTKRKGNDNFDDFLAPPDKKSPWQEDQPPSTSITTITLTEEEEVSFAMMESNLAKVSDTCNKMTEELQRVHMDDSLRVILADLIDSVRTTNKVQEGLAAKVRKNATTTVSVNTQPVISSTYASISSGQDQGPSNGKTSNNSRKKLSGGLYSASADERGKFTGNNKTPAPAAKKIETAEETKVRKFAEAIKDAERSTLCFNLNMGNKPIMNKTTIAERAALALTAMAAKTEGKSNSIPSSEAIAVIDDVTSLVTNMEFFGSNTKQYKGKEGKDDKEGDQAPTFCTVPVKYQFKDREQRVFAEKQLRQVCKVQCATPYPVVVRECIKQVIDHVRKVYPDDFVKVNVHANKFALKVSRRPKGKDLAWIEYPDLLTLPNEAYDISLKKVPSGLKMFFLHEWDSEDNMVTESESHNTPPLP
jgi:hypothetical protein